MSSDQSVFVTLPPIAAGALATAVLMYPVDIMRALSMASATGESAGAGVLLRNFVRAHGLGGLFKQGVAPEMARATWMRISKFFLFPIVHERMWGVPPSQGTGFSKAAAGAVATIPECLSIAPIELAKVGLQLDHTNRYNNSAVGLARQVLRERGWKGWLLGYPALQYRQAAWTGTFFGTLGFFQGHAATVAPNQPVLQQMMAGFAAGMAGAVFNTPGDVVRTNLQKAALAQPGTVQPLTVRYLQEGVLDCGRVGAAIVRQNGPTGLWKGFGFKGLHLGGSGALLAVLIPQFKTMFGVTRE